MDSRLFGKQAQGQYKIRLQQRLAAGDGDASFRKIEGFVCQGNAEHLLRCHGLTA